MTRRPKPRRAPKPIRVHNSLPPRRTEPNAHLCEAIQSHFAFLLNMRPSSGKADGYAEWWQAALIDADAALIAAQRAAINENNAHVASIANGLSLDVKVTQATEAKDAIEHHAKVLQFDALAMAKRIEAANAKHKNKQRSQSANRHLAYHCPTCSVWNEKRQQWSNTIRASADDRLIMCAGRFGAEHPPALCEFDMGSQPDYRLADHAAGTAIAPDASPTDTYADTIHGQHNRSATKLAANKAKYRQIVNATGIVQTNPAPRTDDTSEFGF